MRIQCHRETLASSFQTAGAVAPARSPKPILQNVKLEATAEGGVLSATDLEVGIRVTVPGIEVSAPGSVVLPVSRFGSILKESLDEQLHIETDGSNIVVQGRHSEFRLPAEDPAEFPPVTPFQEQQYHELPARALKELIRRTVFATDSESTRYALGGVLMELTPETLTGVATDGRRLAKVELQSAAIGGHQAPDGSTIVPTRALTLIERSLGESESEVRLAFRANDMLARNDRVTVYARLVEGRFPRWREVIPRRDNTVRIELPVGPFFSAVRQAAIVTNEDSRGLDFDFRAGNVQLSSRGSKIGQSKVELPIAYDGREVGITLDPRFFSDFLRVLDAEKSFTLELSDAESAAVCSTDDGYTYVVMPLARDR